MSKTLILRPRLSEKTYGLSESRVYVVDVPKTANKHGVARAVEAQFEVKVDKVNITNIKGKSKRIISLTGKRSRNAEGRRPDIKKAYVTLAEGNSLPFFAAIEEEEQKEQKVQEQVDKAAAKQSAKEAKQTAKKSPTKKPVAKKAAPAAEKPVETKAEETSKPHRRRFFLRGRKGKADE
ncbi:MAG TPA: 50S ribosomal protein L23 [Candidatus Saccharimonadales bacterium]|nr:50S ribosomal protein L23 [Candidatus Saccharimonadales bacterium]